MITFSRNFLLLLFASCFITITYGQLPVYIGLKGGISIPNLSGGNNHINPLQNGYKSSLRGDFGILAEFPINKKIAIQTEINYSQEGGKNVGLQAFLNPYTDLVDQPYLYAHYKSEVKLDYLMVPVMAKINFPLTKKWNFFINAGIFGAYVLSANSATGGTSHVYLDDAGQQEQDVYPNAVFSFEDKENVKDSIKAFNVGAIAAIGISYDLGCGKIFMDLGGNFGFLDLQKNKSDDKNYAGAVTMHIGYAYKLRRKTK